MIHLKVIQDHLGVYFKKKGLSDIDSILKTKEPCETPDIPAITGLVLADMFVSTGIFLPLGLLNKLFTVNY